MTGTCTSCYMNIYIKKIVTVRKTMGYFPQRLKDDGWQFIILAATTAYLWSDTTEKPVLWVHLILLRPIQASLWHNFHWPYFSGLINDGLDGKKEVTNWADISTTDWCTVAAGHILWRMINQCVKLNTYYLII